MAFTFKNQVVKTNKQFNQNELTDIKYAGEPLNELVKKLTDKVLIFIPKNSVGKMVFTPGGVFTFDAIYTKSKYGKDENLCIKDTVKVTYRDKKLVGRAYLKSIPARRKDGENKDAYERANMVKFTKFDSLAFTGAEGQILDVQKVEFRGKDVILSVGCKTDKQKTNANVSVKKEVAAVAVEPKKEVLEPVKLVKNVTLTKPASNASNSKPIIMKEASVKEVQKTKEVKVIKEPKQAKEPKKPKQDKDKKSKDKKGKPTQVEKVAKRMKDSKEEKAKIREKLLAAQQQGSSETRLLASLVDKFLVDPWISKAEKIAFLIKVLDTVPNDKYINHDTWRLNKRD